MVLRQIIQRIQTWARRLWRSLASNPPVASKQRHPDTSQFSIGGEAMASANNSQDAHPSAEPLKRCPGEVIPGRPGTEAGNDKLETPGNLDPNSNEAAAPSCDTSEKSDPPAGNVPDESPDSTKVKEEKKKSEQKIPRKIGSRRTRPTPRSGSKS